MKPSLQKKQGGKPNEKLYPTCQRETSGINSVFSITKKMFALHRDKGFSRNRKLPFETMIKLILEMAGNTLDHELRHYSSFSLAMPTVSSFVQRRGLISPDAFLYLFHTFNFAVPFEKQFEGYRLVLHDLLLQLCRQRHCHP